MKRLSYHRAAHRREAWQQAADILIPVGTILPESRSLLVDSWSFCNAHRSLWSAIEHALWAQRHQPIKNRLTAAAKHRP